MAHLVSGKIVNTALRSAPRRSITALYAARSSDPVARQSIPSLSATNTLSLYYTPQLHSTAATLEDVPREYLRYPLPDDCQVLKLPDNRLLAYAEYGSKAPDAHPFIFIHGIPDTRLDACLLSSDRAIAEKLNIRWIGIDRPGMGLSTFHPNRTVLSWVNDLKCLVHHLKLNKYRLFSVSGGTGYALACAKLLPRKQLRSVGIAFGVGPWEAGLKGTSLLNRTGLWVWEKHPWVFRKILDRFVVPKVQEESPKKTEEMIRKQNKYMQKKDREALGSEEAIQGLVKITREIYRQGSSKGYVEDSKLATRHWGFDLEQVEYSGIRFWYGKQDINTPPEMGRYMATRLPNAVLKEYEGKSHFTMWDYIEEILTEMLQDE
jgi:pimeloyl-ACP methyl ester carboxylesterase